jgi:mRNA interferase RelE/StbE
VPAYRVEIAVSASHEMLRLSPALLARIDPRIMALAEDPRPPGAQKLTGLNAHRIRVGDYRVIYEIDDVSRTVTVTRVRHRGEVYRKLR